MLTLAMPQSCPAREELLGLAQAFVKIGRRQALRDAVVDRRRPRRESDRSSRRGSGRTSPRRRSACRAGPSRGPARRRNPDDRAVCRRRRSRLPGRAASRAAIMASTARSADRAGPSARRLPTDRRSGRSRYTRTSRSSNPRTTDSWTNSRRSGRAPLAGGARRAAKAAARKARSRFGTRGDDDAVVAAQLQERPAQPARDDLADGPAHPATPGRRNQRQTPIVGHPLAHLVAAADAER